MDKSEGYIWRVPATEDDLKPWCVVTEGTWTWFGAILLTLVLVVVSNLKYYRKVISKPKNLQKAENEKVLNDYLLTYQRGLGWDLPCSNISVQEFKTAYKDRKKEPAVYKLEFSAAITVDESLPTLTAQLAANQALNRTADCIPYDYNGVSVEGEYINASLCTGYKDRKYILTQGPLDKTVPTFWKMIWEQKSSTIVMLTKTFDFIRVMCVEYWPSVGNQERYGNLTVKNVKETHFANFVIREFKLTLSPGVGLVDTLHLQDPVPGEEREVVQFQYTDWSCHGEPVIETLLDLRRRIIHSLESSTLTGPCVVHCNDGGGRTGVYVLLDYNISLLEEEEQVDICGKLKSLRKERMNLVATQAQYRLIYHIIHRYICTSLKLRSRGDIDKMLKQDIGEYEIKCEHELLTRLVSPLGQGECAGAHRDENRKKNRNHLIVPPDTHRPYITSHQGSLSSDYINAVYVDGFRRSKEFIVTEWPLSSTISDFWSMVYDTSAGTIVILEKMKISGKFVNFYPNEPEKITTYGPVFTVERVPDERYEYQDTVGNGSTTDVQKLGNGTKPSGDQKLLNGHESLHYSSFTVNIRKHEVSATAFTKKKTDDSKSGASALSSLVAGVTKQKKSCKIFTLENYPSGLLNLVEGVKRWEAETGEADQPVVVMSSDGVNRVGLYTLLSYARDQFKLENKVNVIQE